MKCGTRYMHVWHKVQGGTIDTTPPTHTHTHPHTYTCSSRCEKAIDEDPGDLLCEHLELVREAGMRRRGVRPDEDTLVDIGGAIAIRPRKARRYEESVEATIELIIHTVRTKTTFLNLMPSLHGAWDIFSKFQAVVETASLDVFDKMVGKYTLQKSLLFLADAVDEQLKRRIAVARGVHSADDRLADDPLGDFAGVGFETDESPPSGTQPLLFFVAGGIG